VHREYAIEPAVLGDWHSLRLLVGHLGWEHGRLISRIPKEWFREACQALSVSGRAGARAEECLRRAKEALVVRHGRAHDPLQSWLDNVRVCHAQAPFQAVIVRGTEAGTTDCVLADELDTEADYWRVADTAKRRNLSTMVEAMRLLLLCGSEVRIVDPYLRPSAAQPATLLRAILKLAHSTEYRGFPASVEIHTGLGKGAAEKSYEFLRSDYERALPPLIPEGVSVHVVIWAERKAQQQLHNRHLLTNRGGITLGAGISTADAETYEDVSRMSESDRRLRWQQYDRQSRVFDRAGPDLVFSGSSPKTRK
jgi:hypothetical protein